MSAYREVSGALKELPPRQRAAFAAACAERMLPLVRRLGDARNVSLFELGLDTAWAAVAGRRPGVEVSRLLSKVRRAANGLGGEEGDSPEFYVMRALHVLGYALASLREPGAEQSAWACSELLGVRSGFDLVLQTEPPHTVVIDPNDPPPPGPLQAREIEVQRETLRLLRSKPEPDDKVVNSLRRVSEDAAREFDRAIPEFGTRMNWHI
ncbi:MAG TPA: hypothetical protein VF591_22295 [Pyrinomonadaceae bacterium]|jgi:hypothetical protein